MRADVCIGPSAAGLCGRRLWRSRLFAGEIRHPDRTAAPRKAGRCQRLDRGNDCEFDHPGHGARRRTDQPSSVRRTARAGPAPHQYRHRHAGRIGNRRDRRGLRAGSIIQFLDSGHRRALSAPADQSAAADRRLFEVPWPALARQARTDLAGGDNDVLGSRRHAAVHRAQVGRGPARHATLQSGYLAGRGGGRDSHRRGGGGALRAAARITARVALRRGDGGAGAAHDAGP